MRAGLDVAEASAVAGALKVADRVRPAVIVLPWLGRRPVREALAAPVADSDFESALHDGRSGA